MHQVRHDGRRLAAKLERATAAAEPDGHTTATMSEDGRRVLELLAATPNGASEALLLARGFSGSVIFELLQAGCVRKTHERTLAAGRPVHIDRVVIPTRGGWRSRELNPAAERSIARVSATRDVEI